MLILQGFAPNVLLLTFFLAVFFVFFFYEFQSQSSSHLCNFKRVVVLPASCSASHMQVIWMICKYAQCPSHIKINGFQSEVKIRRG